MLNKQLHLVCWTCLLASGYVYSLKNCIPKEISSNLFLRYSPFWLLRFILIFPIYKMALSKWSLSYDEVMELDHSDKKHIDLNLLEYLMWLWMVIRLYLMSMTFEWARYMGAPSTTILRFLSFLHSISAKVL